MCTTDVKVPYQICNNQNKSKYHEQLFYMRNFSNIYVLMRCTQIDRTAVSTNTVSLRTLCNIPAEWDHHKTGLLQVNVKSTRWQQLTAVSTTRSCGSDLKEEGGALSWRPRWMLDISTTAKFITFCVNIFNECTSVVLTSTVQELLMQTWTDCHFAGISRDAAWK